MMRRTDFREVDWNCANHAADRYTCYRATSKKHAQVLRGRLYYHSNGNNDAVQLHISDTAQSIADCSL